MKITKERLEGAVAFLFYHLGISSHTDWWIDERDTVFEVITVFFKVKQSFYISKKKQLEKVMEDLEEFMQEVQFNEN
jgi:hypothetical protein